MRFALVELFYGLDHIVDKLGDRFEPVLKKKQKLSKSLLQNTGGEPALEKMANRRRGGGRYRRPESN